MSRKFCSKCGISYDSHTDRERQCPECLVFCSTRCCIGETGDCFDCQDMEDEDIDYEDDIDDDIYSDY